MASVRGGAGYPDAIDLFDRAYTLQVNDLKVTGLQIKFDVKRSLNPKTPNSARIEIANLADETRQRLQGFGRVFVSLSAGYAEGQSLIFRGDLREVSSAKDGREWITTVTSGDGEKARKKKRLNKTYPPGTPMSKLLVETARALGVDMGNVEKAAANAQLWGAKPAQVLGGFAATGDALSTFDRVCRSCGIEWSIQDNQLQLLPHGQSLQERGPNISEASGLVGSPELGKSGITKIRTLMIPNLQPGRRIELEARHANGIYRIETVNYQGDMSGDEWGAELELKIPATASTTGAKPASDGLDDPRVFDYYNQLSPALAAVANPYMQRALQVLRDNPTRSQARVDGLRAELVGMDAAVKFALNAL